MDQQRAKFLLQAGHPRIGDRQESAFAEAEEAAASNPELQDWVQKQQALTDSLGRKLDEIPVPDDLRGRILAGGAISSRNRTWNRRRWLALAAGLALVLGLSIWQMLRFSPGSEENFAGLRHDMTEFLSGIFTLELSSRQLPKLQSYLAEEHRFTDYQVPVALTEHESVGCRMIDWHDRQIALICFMVEGELVHLMVLPRDRIPDEPEEGRVLQSEVNDWSTASWVDEQNVYLVSTRGSEAFLSALLPQI